MRDCDGTPEFNKFAESALTPAERKMLASFPSDLESMPLHELGQISERVLAAHVEAAALVRKFTETGSRQIMRAAGFEFGFRFICRELANEFGRRRTTGEPMAQPDNGLSYGPAIFLPPRKQSN